MPKKLLLDNLPTWNALVAELSDPRPYEPLTIPASYAIPNDAFVDVRLAFEAAWSELDRDVDDALSDLDDVDRDATAAFDALYPWPVAAQPTVVVPALALVDADATVILPAWPLTGASEEETS